MIRELWLNLPVKDVNRSREFFRKIGFSIHPAHEKSEKMAGIIVSDRKIMVMLFPESDFKNFSQAEVSDTAKGAEMLISIDAASREEVDDIANKAAEAGGKVFGKPGESQGWLYGCGFSDLDGHRWNILYRDMEKMPKS